MLPRLDVKCPSLEVSKPEALSSPGQSPKQLGSEHKRPGALIRVLEQSAPETPSNVSNYTAEHYGLYWRWYSSSDCTEENIKPTNDLDFCS